MLQHENLNVILGPPGTGKTTYLLNLIEQFLDQGVSAKRIGFFSFTRKAATEAKDRALKKFPHLKTYDFVYFRTLHSLSYMQLNVSRSEVMDKEHYRELADILGIEVSKGYDGSSFDGSYGMKIGERYLFIENLARITNRPLREVWEESSDEELSWLELERISRALIKYKENRLLYDYTDLITKMIDLGSCPELDYLIIDEAQDLSTIQWQLVAKLAKYAKHVYVAGDDDQAIYSWAGADVDTFINLEGRTKILEQSYRIPSSVHKLALSLTDRMLTRKDKTFVPRKEEGLVEYYGDIDEVDMSEGKWLVLVRNSYLLKKVEDCCEYYGFSYNSPGWTPLKSKALKAVITWEDIRKGKDVSEEQIDNMLKYTSKLNEKSFNQFNFYGSKIIWHEILDKISYREREYFIAALRRGETLTGTPRIKITTMHASKGGEEDNVVVLSDISPKTERVMRDKPDEETRVFYVAITRTRKNLHIVQPNGKYYFDI